MSHTNTRVDKDDPAFLYLDLHPDEQIIMIVRHHWAGFLPTILIIVAMALIPLVILMGLNSVFTESIVDLSGLITILFTGYILFLLTFAFGAWINYYYDIIFITNERIINVDQEGLLARKTSELSMNQVQNVSADVAGFLPSIFDYGVLVVETAGGGTSDDPHRPGIQGYFTITAVPDPNRVARLILDLHREATSENA